MKKIAVLSSGGDAPGMNAAIRAVVRAAVAADIEVAGVMRGYQGLIDGLFTSMNARSVSGIIHHGGTILRTARCPAFMRPEGRAQAAAQMREAGVEGLVVIGGDGSYRGAHAMCAEHDVACVGIPGTIDNDVGGTDYTIGFDTAMNIAVEAIDRLRDTAAAHERIFFVEVMGRHSGFIAMYSGLAGGAEEMLVPERPTDIGALIESLRAGRERGKSSMIIVVAEGDDMGNAAEIAARVAAVSEFKETRVSVIGHLQRGGTPSAFDRVLAARMGGRAVEVLVEGQRDVMIAASGASIVVRPITDAWEMHNSFDDALYRLARVLSV